MFIQFTEHSQLTFRSTWLIASFLAIVVANSACGGSPAGSAVPTSPTTTASSPPSPTTPAAPTVPADDCSGGGRMARIGSSLTANIDGQPFAAVCISVSEHTTSVHPFIQFFAWDRGIRDAASGEYNAIVLQLGMGGPGTYANGLNWLAAGHVNASRVSSASYGSWQWTWFPPPVSFGLGNGTITATILESNRAEGTFSFTTGVNMVSENGVSRETTSRTVANGRFSISF